MALTDPYITTAAARWPASTDLAPARVLFAYNPLADELVAAFGGINRPAVTDPLDGPAGNYLQLRLDLETEQLIVGVQLDSARRIAAVQHPAWGAVIDAAAAQSSMDPLDPSAWPAVSAFVADVMALSRQ